MARWDLIGYALGAVLLFIAGWAQWRKQLHPPREQVWFAVFGVVLLAMSLTMPGGDNRLLAFIGLWSMWLIGQRWPEQSKRVALWLSRAFMVFVLADAVWHIGRPAWINPNTEGAFLLLSLPFMGNKRWVILWVVSIICTGSRGAMLAVLLPLVWWNRELFNRRRMLALVLAVIVVGLVMVRPATAQVRLDHWGEALRLFSASPIIGWGPGSYIDVSRIPFQNHADNALLTLLAEQGLVGVLSLAPLAVVVVLQWRTGGPELVRLALLATLLHQLVDDSWLGPWTALLIGLNLALVWRFNAVPEETLAGADDAGSRAPAPTPAVGPALE